MDPYIFKVALTSCTNLKDIFESIYCLLEYSFANSYWNKKIPASNLDGLSPNFVNWLWGISELGNTFTEIPNLICFCFCFCFFFLPLSLLIAQFFYAINDMMNPLSNKLGCLFKSLALPQNLCALIPRFSSIALDFTT